MIRTRVELVRTPLSRGSTQPRRPLATCVVTTPSQRPRCAATASLVGEPNSVSAAEPRHDRPARARPNDDGGAAGRSQDDGAGVGQRCGGDGGWVWGAKRGALDGLGDHDRLRHGGGGRRDVGRGFLPGGRSCEEREHGADGRQQRDEDDDVRGEIEAPHR